LGHARLPVARPRATRSASTLRFQGPLEAAADAPFVGEWGGRKVPFQPALSGHANQWDAFFAVSYDLGHSSRVFCVKTREDGSPCLVSATIEVLEGKFPSTELKVDHKRVEPPPEEERRIAREQEELDRAYASSPSQREWSGPFRLPIRSKITSPFGVQRLYNGKRKSYHAGLDLRAPIGTPVRAAARGRVVIAKDLYLTGNTVILDHGFGLFTLYCHLSTIGVSEGQVLRQGELLGKSGDTGRVTGPHLHWAAKANLTFFNPLDLTNGALMAP